MSREVQVNASSIAAADTAGVLVSARCGKRCLSPDGARCELLAGHDGAHRNGGLIWHDPPLLLVGGKPVEPLSERELALLDAIGSPAWSPARKQLLAVPVRHAGAALDGEQLPLDAEVALGRPVSRAPLGSAPAGIFSSATRRKVHGTSAPHRSKRLDRRPDDVEGERG